MIRLIDEANNQVGIVQRNLALDKANEAELDLVEVSPTSEPPVCRIMDYGKWLYEQKRKVRESHKKSQHHSAVLKEIRLRPETDKHDIEIKTNHAREFLQKGYKVQFTLFFRGRQMLHQDKGHEIFNQISESLQELSKIEQAGRIMNKRMTLLLVPK
jgi:translation initiation factor IF-3